MLKVERTQVVVDVDEVDAVCFQVGVILGRETKGVVVAHKQCKIPNALGLDPGKGPLVQGTNSKLVLTLALNPYQITSWGLHQTAKPPLPVMRDFLIWPCTGRLSPQLNCTIHITRVQPASMLDYIIQNVF